MPGIYLSGTGNTKHCVEKLTKLVEDDAKCYPLEHPQIMDILNTQDTIFLGYPTQFSNAPFMVREFINRNASLWKGKKVFLINTMGLFSGDAKTERDGCFKRGLKRPRFLFGGMEKIAVIYGKF